MLIAFSSKIFFVYFPLSKKKNLMNRIIQNTPSVLRPLNSLTRRVAPSAGTIGELNWPPSQPLKAVSPLPDHIQAWSVSFTTNQPTAILEISRRVFASPLRPDLVHRAVTYERNLQRQGTHSTRTRSQVRGSTRKVAPQKGLGAARHGTRRAPQFVGGARAHGPVPRSHATEIQRKVWLMALRSVLSAKFRQDQLVIVDDMALGSHKTGELDRMLQVNGWAPLKSTGRRPSVMLMPLMDESLKNLEIAQRNLQGLELVDAREAEVYEIMRHEYLLLDRQSLDLLQGLLEPL